MASGRTTLAEARRRAAVGRGQALEDGGVTVYRGKKKSPPVPSPSSSSASVLRPPSSVLRPPSSFSTSKMEHQGWQFRRPSPAAIGHDGYAAGTAPPPPAYPWSSSSMTLLLPLLLLLRLLEMEQQRRLTAASLLPAAMTVIMHSNNVRCLLIDFDVLYSF